MVLAYGASLILTFLYYAVLGISFYGWGMGLLVLLRRFHPSFGELASPLAVWMGFAVWLVLLQVLHLVVPVTAYTVIPLLVMGLAVSGTCLVRAIRLGTRFHRLLGSRRSAYATLFLVLVFIWIASRSMLVPTNYDAGLYYFNMIRWINSFPIVPGLGNLHSRLAFNQSFFTYVAALNLYPLFGYGRSIANSFLLILGIVTVLHWLGPVLAKPARVLELPAGQWMPPLFVLPILAFLCLSSKDLASPGPDLAVTLLLILLFLVSCRLLDGYLRHCRIPLSEAVLLTILAATVITIKLSGLVPSALFAGLTVAAVIRRSGRIRRDAALLLLPPAMILLVWMLRGIITSGAPLYPSTLGYLHTSWSIPPEAIRAQANSIYGWARQPWIHYSEVIGNWDWLSGWFQRLHHYPTEVLYPAGSFALLVLGVLGLHRIGRPKARTKPWSWLLLSIPLLAGLVFWFFTAPDVRFARALFFLLPVAAVVPVGLLLQEKLSGRTCILALGFLFLAVNFNYLKWIYAHKDNLFVISYEGWYEIPSPQLIPRRTHSGLTVFTPAQGELEWDAPLPCTPAFNEHLKLRCAPDLSRGFTIEKDSARQNSR